MASYGRYGLGVLGDLPTSSASEHDESGEVIYSSGSCQILASGHYRSPAPPVEDDDEDTSDENTPTQLSVRQFPGPLPDLSGASVPMEREDSNQPLAIEYSVNFDAYGDSRMFVDSGVPLCPYSRSDLYDRVVPILLSIMTMIVNTVEGWEVAPRDPFILHGIQRRFPDSSKRLFLGIALKRPRLDGMPFSLLQLLSRTFHDERMFRAKRHHETDQLMVETDNPLFTGYFHIHQMLYPGCFSIREERVRGEEVISRKSRFIPPHRWFDSQPDSVVEAFGRSYWDKLREASKQTVGEMWEYAEEEDMDDMEGVDIVEVAGAEQDRREPIVAVRGGEDADEAETGLFMRELNEIMEVVDLTTLGRPLLG